MPSHVSSRSDLLGDSGEDQLAMLFDVCKGDDAKASVKVLFEELSKTGIRKDDPRLFNLCKKLRALTPLTMTSYEELKLEYRTFKSVLTENIVIIAKAFQNQLVVPAFDVFCEGITHIFNDCKDIKSGKRSTHIPQLAEQHPSSWGVSVCTIDGQRFSIGDATKPFTMQALSQPLIYAITLHELGEKVVHRYQGREPSGRSTNEIVLDYNNKPHNPLINSGALLSCSLILQLLRPELKDMAQKYDFIFNLMQKLAGNETLEFNNSAFLAEQTSTDRDYALAYFMRENHCFPSDGHEANIKNILEFYFQMLCLEVNCESSSVMAATLANGGTCPITGDKLLSHEAVNHTLDMMYSCGMNIYSGQFAFKCGLPAMAAVSGAIMLVVPGVMGMTLWSPNLDKLGNSERGMHFCRELVAKYAFHRFDSVGAIEGKLDPTVKRSASTTNLIFQALLAAASNDVTFLRRLYLQEFDLNSSDYDGRTPLHLAAAEGHLETVHFLLERAKVDSDPKDRWDQTPLSEAFRFKKSKVAFFIKEHMDNMTNDDKLERSNPRSINAIPKPNSAVRTNNPVAKGISGAFHGPIAEV